MLIKIKETGPITTSAEAAGIFRSLLQSSDKVDTDKEHFWAIGLDTKSRIKYVELVSIGILSSSLVHPRETFRRAIQEAVASVIVGHNHPSGDTTPSRDDISVTKRLKETGDIIGIPLVDHVVINQETHYSIMERGLF